MRGFYRSELGPIARLASDGSWDVLWAAAIPVYILLITGLLFFVLPRAGSTTEAPCARCRAKCGGRVELGTS